jgi:TonB family protein
MAAAEMGLHGRARVGFNLRNTTASDVKIINGSGLALIDRAALAAVQKAVYPNPGSEQKDKTNFRVKVIRSHSFRVSACTQ